MRESMLANFNYVAENRAEFHYGGRNSVVMIKASKDIEFNMENLELWTNTQIYGNWLTAGMPPLWKAQPCDI